MLTRLRENLLLKVISLLSAILLWVYVQAERPLIVTRTLAAAIVTRNVPAGLDVQPLQRMVQVAVTGSQPIVDRLKDGDIQAVLDLKGLRTDQSGQTRVPSLLVFPDFAPGLAYDQSPLVKVQISQQQQKTFLVTPRYPVHPPAGYRYGLPDVRPRSVTITGYSEQLKNIDEVFVLAEPVQTGANIDGDYPVLVHDGDNKPVEGIIVEPERIHVKVELIAEPAEKYVTVSPNFPDQPLPPYQIKEVVVHPNQVKIAGRLEQINQIQTVPTEDILLQGVTENRRIDAKLILPPGVSAFDPSGKRIDIVSVEVKLRKLAAPVVPPANPPSKPADAQQDKTN